MALVYHSVPLAAILDVRYKEFMMRLGPNVKHVIDCHECNEEVISRVKSHALTYRQKAVCPAMIPLSDVAVSNFEE